MASEWPFSGKKVRGAYAPLTIHTAAEAAPKMLPAKAAASQNQPCRLPGPLAKKATNYHLQSLVAAWNSGHPSGEASISAYIEVTVHR
jgi:hypothetical protein